MTTQSRTWGLRYRPAQMQQDDEGQTDEVPAQFSWGWGDPGEDVSALGEDQIARRFGQGSVQLFRDGMEAGGRATVGAGGPSSAGFAGTDISAATPAQRGQGPENRPAPPAQGPQVGIFGPIVPTPPIPAQRRYRRSGDLIIDDQTGVAWGLNLAPQEALTALGIDRQGKPAGAGGAGTGTGAGAGGSSLTTPPAGAGSAQGGDAYASFKQKFREIFGRDVTQPEMNDGAFLATLRNDIIMSLPLNRLWSDPAFRDTGVLRGLPNEFLQLIIRDNPNIIGHLGAGRMSQFSRDFLEREVFPHLATQGQQGLMDQIKQAAGIASAPPAGAPGGPAAGAPGAGAPGDGAGAGAGAGAAPTTPAEDIPATHAWVLESGASEWARRKRSEGVEWAQITPQLMRADTASQWSKWASDPKYAQLYKYAQEYFARTGFWPTEIELNKFTQNAPDVPNLLPDGTLVPKSSSKAGEYEKWVIPKGPDGQPIPLPKDKQGNPIYEWRFTADGTPIPYDLDQTTLDIFSGYYLDPKTGLWDYNPLLGAADYLQSQDQAWTDQIGGFAAKTGRLPTLEEARALAANVWAQADPEAKRRAEQFAAANGFWPTPFELEFGPAKDTDANAGGGKAGQPGVGQVPVFVPGVGMVLIQGQAAGTGGYVFDPFQGIPGQVRPWIREVLNGRLSIDQVPPELRQWADFALNQFQDQIPKKAPDELPGFGAPTIGQPPVGAGEQGVGDQGAGAVGLTVEGMQAAFGSQSGGANYNPAYDLNGDGKIDILDYSLLNQQALQKTTQQATAGGAQPGAGAKAAPQPFLTGERKTTPTAPDAPLERGGAQEQAGGQPQPVPVPQPILPSQPAQPAQPVPVPQPLVFRDGHWSPVGSPGTGTEQLLPSPSLPAGPREPDRFAPPGAPRGFIPPAGPREPDQFAPPGAPRGFIPPRLNPDLSPSSGREAEREVPEIRFPPGKRRGKQPPTSPIPPVRFYPAGRR